MKYYVSDKAIHALKKGMPFCDVYMPREKTDTRKRAIDIAILASCHACDQEFVLEEKNEHVDGDFCDHCLKVHGV
jgi:hypothetical protein